MKKYRTIYADPPWNQKFSGKWKKHKSLDQIPYPVMTIREIEEMPISYISDVGCHLWLWTTNQFLRQGFDVMEKWGFKYLAPITWVKPSGIGNWFVHRTQTLLFGYKDKCVFDMDRYRPTVLFANSSRHSKKPEEMRMLVEAISEKPRLELFAREKHDGWDVWGDEVESDIEL